MRAPVDGNPSQTYQASEHELQQDSQQKSQQKDSPVISVVVPCRWQAEELRYCLKALHYQTLTLPYEVIVVSGEAEPAIAEVVGQFPAVRLIESKAGLTPGEARNLGAEHARGKYLTMTDADCTPEPDWLLQAITALENGAIIVGGAVLDGRPLNPIAVTDNLLQFMEFSPHRPDGTISLFPTANCAMRREAFDELGGFIPGIVMGADALFNRAAAKRWPGGIKFLNAMRVSHAGRGDLRSFWKHQALLGFYRGRLGVGLRNPLFRRLGRYTIFAIPIACKRLSFLVVRTIRWNPAGLWRIVILLPILLVGLAAWTKAFRDGCRAAAEEAT